MFRRANPLVSFTTSLLTLFSPLCFSCGRAASPALRLCASCSQSLPTLPHHCEVCANILTHLPEKKICNICEFSPPAYQKVRALFPYTPPISLWVTQLKFHEKLIYARLFADLLLLKIKNEWYQNKLYPDLIIPIPLHKARLRQRGFNQSIEIIRPVTNQLQLKLDIHSTMRIKTTQPQTHLSASERALNVRNSFMTTQNFHNKSIVIFDDVVTTGHTIQAFSSMLKKHGANHIEVWCIAKRI